MFVIGELRDKKIADEVVRLMSERDIPVMVSHIQNVDMYILTVEKAEHVAMATDCFRVKMGLAKPVEIEAEWIQIKALPNGFLTMTVLGFCVALYLLTFLDLGKPLYELLFFGSKEETIHFQGLKSMEWWRIVTPIFLHMNILHILFNMLWFKDLGNIIEAKFSPQFYLTLILFLGITSNLFQYITAGPNFGGMSGVLYGLLGFVWIYKKTHPDFPYSIPSRDMSLMLIWLFLCLTGLLGPIANMAHAGGISMGMIMALVIKRHEINMPFRKRIAIIFVSFLILFMTLIIEGFKMKGEYYILRDLNHSVKTEELI